MSSDLSVIESKLKQVDITVLAKYTKMIGDIGKLQKLLVPQYLRDFINAIDATNNMLIAAIRLDVETDAALKRAEAIAFLDNSKPYLDGRNVKITDKAREQYVQLDPDVINAVTLKAKSTALLTYLKNKMHIFRHAHDAVKKIGYGDQNSTQWEGF